MVYYAQIEISLPRLNSSSVTKMKSLARNEKALSTVVVALIILIIAVLLAGIITMFAINITSARTQQEFLRPSKADAWVYSDGTAYLAVAVDNVGGRDAVIDKIQVRGVEAEWSNVHYLRRSTAISTSLICPNETHSWTGFLYTSGTVEDFTTASTDLPLASGDTIILYVTNPDSINTNGFKDPIGITIYTANSQYPIWCYARSAETA